MGKEKAAKVTKRRRLSMSTRSTLEAYFFVSPFIIGILVFFAYPLLLLLYLSFGSLDNIVGLKIHFVGFDNFEQAFFGDLQISNYLQQTLSDTAKKVPLTIIFSLLIAILVNKDIKCRGFFPDGIFSSLPAGQWLCYEAVVGSGCQR